MFYFDLDELEELNETIFLFSVNRSNLITLHEQDHIQGSATSSKQHLMAFLETSGISLNKPKIYLLTQCRVFGYVFNPISVFYCHESNGALRAIVAEVNNTFGERHLYLLRSDRLSSINQASHRSHFRAEKALHVSPFLSMNGHYDFWFGPVGSTLNFRILHSESDQPTLNTEFMATRLELSKWSAVRLITSYPLAAIKTIAAIHFEAGRLWTKRLPFYQKPKLEPSRKTQRQVLDKLKL